MTATIAAPTTAASTVLLSRYICDANARFAGPLEVTFRWLTSQPQADLELAPGIPEVFDRFISAIRNRCSSKAALEIAFTQEPDCVTVSARYVIGSTRAADLALFSGALFDPGQQPLKKRCTLAVESFAYWEEAKLSYIA